MTIDNDQIIANLREVFDPEISINIYDLGLIYDIAIDEAEKEVTITHTLTSAFCPFADQIVSDIQKAGYVPEVISVIINTYNGFRIRRDKADDGVVNISHLS